MILIYVWITIAAIITFLAKKVIDDNAANIAYNTKAVWITCIIFGIFWPLLIIASVIIWFIKMRKVKRMMDDIDEKISSSLE